MSEATIPGSLNNGENTQYWNGTAWVTTNPGGVTNIAYYGSSGGNTTTLGADNDFGSGRGGNDSLGGGEGNDALIGGAGADSLAGGGGADTMIGANATMTGSLDSGQVTVTGVASDGSSIDTMSGGTGDDTYVVTSAGDVIFDGVNGGTDTVLIASNLATSYSVGLLASIEKMGVLDPSLTTGVSLSANSGNQAITGGAGGDTLSGGIGSDTLDGLGGADSLSGGDNDDVLRGAGTDTLLGGGGNDSFALSGSGNVVDGGAGAADRIIFSTAGTYTITGGPGAFTVTGPGAETNTVSNVEFIAGGAADSMFGAGSFYVCFAGGTRIRTDRGDVAVESLRAGDLVATVSGRGAPLKPVLWIGRRRVVLAGHPNAEAIAPIRIRAGALAENTPSRDLLVSPDHCLFLNGALVPARLLVNGSSITVEAGLAEVTYYHVELEGHDVLLAEGAAAESWLDCDNRTWFENAPVARIGVSGTLAEAGSGWDASRACAPLLHGGEALAAIRAAIAARSADAARAAA
jgi:Ca2+-binding RTX toxin-like protein